MYVCLEKKSSFSDANFERMQQAFGMKLTIYLGPKESYFFDRCLTGLSTSTLHSLRLIAPFFG